MLKQPYSGKELYIRYEKLMGRMYIEISPEEETEEWDKLGKTKKQSWNNLAKEINERMRMEAQS